MLTKHILCYKIFFKTKNVSKKLKLRLKHTIIKRTLTHTSETWTQTETESN